MATATPASAATTGAGLLALDGRSVLLPGFWPLPLALPDGLGKEAFIRRRVGRTFFNVLLGPIIEGFGLAMVAGLLEGALLPGLLRATG